MENDKDKMPSAIGSKLLVFFTPWKDGFSSRHPYEGKFILPYISNPVVAGLALSKIVKERDTYFISKSKNVKVDFRLTPFRSAWLFTIVNKANKIYLFNDSYYLVTETNECYLLSDKKLDCSNRCVEIEGIYLYRLDKTIVETNIRSVEEVLVETSAIEVCKRDDFSLEEIPSLKPYNSSNMASTGAISERGYLYFRYLTEDIEKAEESGKELLLRIKSSSKNKEWSVALIPLALFKRWVDCNCRVRGSMLQRAL